MQKENAYVLTINGGSSSIKFALYDMVQQGQSQFAGKIHRIGAATPQFTVTRNKQQEKKDMQASGFQEATAFLTTWLGQQEAYKHVRCIGHRLVHGMQHTQPEIISNELLKELEDIQESDPDHLPAELELIRHFQKHQPAIPQIACFDTAFHTTMPRLAKMLPLPRRFEKAGLQRYGFHGLSYAWLMEELTKNNEEKGKIILAHLGSGASMAAVKNGVSIDTTMGFTPTGGLVMSERTGDMDPGVATWLMQTEGLTIQQYNHLINHESGLLGISETSGDVLELLQKEEQDIRAKEAIDFFCYNARKWIGALTTTLGGLDTLVFSGGIGENAAIIRARICDGLQYAGILLDEGKNNQHARNIAAPNSSVKIYVIPTDEEQMIAKLTTAVYEQSTKSKPSPVK